MIVNPHGQPSPVLPLAERQAIARARIRRVLDVTLMPLALVSAVLSLWLLTRLQLAVGLTLLAVTFLLAVGACGRLVHIGQGVEQ